MKKVIVFFLFFTYGMPGISNDYVSIDSLLMELDREIFNSKYYVEQKEIRLNRLKNQYEREIFNERKYELCNQIIQEYKSYISDSALLYIHKNNILSEKSNKTDWQIVVNLQASFVLTSSGLFLESENMLKKIPKENLSDELLIEYYKNYELLYTNQITYYNTLSSDDSLKGIIRKYRDSVLLYLPLKAPDRIYYQYLLTDSVNQIDKALQLLESQIQGLHSGTQEYAQKRFFLSQLYCKIGNEEEQIRNLILSAICDIQDVVKDNRAMMELAICLHKKGESKKAYEYIHYALKDANFYNSRTRKVEIAVPLLEISSSFNQQIAREHNQLDFILTMVVLLSTLFILLGSYLFYLKRVNLQKLKKQLQEKDQILSQYTVIKQINERLIEDLHLREKQIGGFISFCSDQLAYLEDFRKMVKAKVIAKRYDDLSKVLIFSSEKYKNLKEFYTYFDTTFLDIFPGFVESLNQLLKPEDRLVSKKNDLTTELRIYALIRLNIVDSLQIASILRCSVQTVYNYRSKIKKSCLIEPLDMDAEIKKIGTIIVRKK